MGAMIEGRLHLRTYESIAMTNLESIERLFIEFVLSACANN